ncbi:MAG: TatD family hydrolase [Desulfurococcaceae archaeon]
MLYSDVHLHVNPVRGLGAEKVAKKFKSKGGWFISIISLPPYHYGFTDMSVESYRKSLDLITREAMKAKTYGLEVVKFLGFHPAEIDNYYKLGVRSDKLLKLVDEVFELMESALRDNLIDGIGEVGRQHYGTSPERFVFSESVMIRALMLARDYNVPIQLHLEQGGLATAYSIKLLAGTLGISTEKTIIHHANLETAIWSDSYGVVFTAPIRYFDERYASNKWRYCMIESDYIDDPSRPGASAYPWEIPDTINKFIEKNVLTEEQAYKILVDNVVKTFGVNPP